MALVGVPWMLDITIKPLYGKQEGAEAGFNPKKPDRDHPNLYGKSLRSSCP